MKAVLAVAAAATILVCAPPALAQTRTLDTFVTEANRVPMNPTAVLRSDARRLMNEGRNAFRAVGQEIEAARTAGRRPPACPGERVNVNAREMLAFLNAIPAERRRRMSPTDGIRAWMADRYPCPAS